MGTLILLILNTLFILIPAGFVLLSSITMYFAIRMYFRIKSIYAWIIFAGIVLAQYWVIYCIISAAAYAQVVAMIGRPPENHQAIMSIFLSSWQDSSVLIWLATLNVGLILISFIKEFRRKSLGLIRAVILISTLTTISVYSLYVTIDISVDEQLQVSLQRISDKKISLKNVDIWNASLASSFIMEEYKIHLAPSKANKGNTIFKRDRLIKTSWSNVNLPSSSYINGKIIPNQKRFLKKTYNFWLAAEKSPTTIMNFTRKHFKVEEYRSLKLRRHDEDLEKIIVRSIVNGKQNAPTVYIPRNAGNNRVAMLCAGNPPHKRCSMYFWPVDGIEIRVYSLTFTDWKEVYGGLVLFAQNAISERVSNHTN